MDEKYKQIDEMYKDVKCIHRCFLEDDDFDYLDEYIAVKLYKKGYRKSTDLAREIFEEIEKTIADLEYRANTPRKTVKVEELKAQCDWILHEVLPKTLAELKKKYTESEDSK